MSGKAKFIPLRQSPKAPDSHDQERINLVVDAWKAQDPAHLGFARTVEEHIRMLSGRHWDVWSDALGRYIDVLRYMSDEERKHRMRPVMDYLGYWFMLTLSKATENQPVISFMPATADRLDAMLAEVMDPIWKTLFGEMEMDARIINAIAWALVAGEAYLYTRTEFQAGAERELIGPAVLSMQGADGQMIERVAEGVPYDKDGNALAQLIDDPENPGEYGYEATGDPYVDQEGAPRVDVLCPLEIRAQWGQQIPWRDKRWITHRWFLTPDQVEEQYGVRCEPDCYAAEDDGPGYLERILFGTGYFGAASAMTGNSGQDVRARAKEGYVCGYTRWEKPSPGTDTAENEGSPGGRLLVVTKDQVLWDSLRPAKFECAGPIRKLGFIGIPGRPHDSTPLEKLVPLQKRLNRIEAQVAEHTNLVTNPILLLHEAAGIDEDEFVARPGLTITHGYNGSGAPAVWLQPPNLSADVWRHKSDVREQLFVIGSMAGNQSAAPTQDSSGELVEQLRFNADRPLTPLTRNLVLCMADIAEDVLALLPTIWTEEKVIAYAGSDNVVRTVTVLPEMFSGRVNVKPSIESASAESKSARRQRLMQFFTLGAFGDPRSPQAMSTLLELSQFPDLNRATRPGGVDRVMAEHNLGRLVRGEPATEIPILEVYDLIVHRMVLEQFMKSPEYLTTEPAVQAECVTYREMVLQAIEIQALAEMARQAPIARAQAALAGASNGAGAAAAAANGPPPPAPGDAGNEPGAPPTPPEAPRQDSRAA